MAKRRAVLKKRKTPRKRSAGKAVSTATKAAKGKTAARAAASRKRIRKPAPKPSRVAAATTLVVGDSEPELSANSRDA